MVGNQLNATDIYIALEDKNFDWKPKDVIRFRTLWYEGKSIKGIAKTLKRSVLETSLLMIDQADKGFIEPRDTGIWGCNDE